MIKRIFYPLKYLTLLQKNAETGKSIHIILKTDAFSVIISVACIFFCSILLPINFFGKEGIINNLGNFASILIGFYITALGVISTFEGKGLSLDDIIPDERGSMYTYDAMDRELKLTRRKYLCLMFGYLSFIAIICYLSSVVINYLAVIIKQYISNFYIFMGIRSVVIVCFFIIFTHMIIVTLEGIYYISYRIHDVKIKFINKNSN